MKNFATRSPVAFSIGIFLIQLLFGGGVWLYQYLGVNYARQAGPWQPFWLALLDSYALVYSLFYTLVAVGLIASLKWWQEVGFVPLEKKQALKIYLLPSLFTLIVLMPGLSWSAVVERISFSTLLFYTLLAIREELFNRGLIQHALTQKGETYAIWMSTLLFGLIHISGLLFGTRSLFVTVRQVLRTLAWGFGIAVLRTRVRSIYPLILLHFFTNLFEIAVEASFADRWWLFTTSWFANLHEIAHWVLVFELPNYLIGAYGLYLLKQKKGVREHAVSL